MEVSISTAKCVALCSIRSLNLIALSRAVHFKITIPFRGHENFILILSDICGVRSPRITPSGASLPPPFYVKRFRARNINRAPPAAKKIGCHLASISRYRSTSSKISRHPNLYLSLERIYHYH